MLARWLGKMFSVLDAWAEASVGGAFSPFTRLGTLSVTSIVIATATGVALLPFYDVSAHGAYGSVARMLAEKAWYAGVLHSLHRYASDAAVFFAGLHFLRVLSNRAYCREQATSWVTGIFATFLLWFIGWLGYWLVWDQAGFLVARSTARVLDSMPIFGTPVGRGLLLDKAVNNQIFFVIFFVHMIVPLAALVVLWIHVFRVQRPVFLADRRNAAALVMILGAFATAVPATIDIKASPLLLRKSVAGDLFFLLPLRFFDAVPLWVILAITVGGFLALGSVPWLVRRRSSSPSVVDESRCSACMNCINDCPYGAIELVPRTDGKTLKGVARVDPLRCLSCGICNGACDTSANNLPFLPTDAVRARIEAWSKGAPEERRRFLLFVCQDILGEKVRIDDAAGTCAELPGYHVVPVPCAGHVNPRSLKLALELGFEGIFVASSLPGACRYREGEGWTKQRIAGDRRPHGGLSAAQRDRIHSGAYGRASESRLWTDATAFARSAGGP